MSQPLVIFSHGKDGSPWGAKIEALAEVARRKGFAVESIDYRDTNDPLVRLQRLLEACKTLPPNPVLVGSSLGGFVATAASREVQARGLFLLAPAFFIPGYEQHTPQPAECPVAIVHGWRDDIVPPANSVRYAQQYRTSLHLLDGGHRLQENIPQLCSLFDYFLGTV